MRIKKSLTLGAASLAAVLTGCSFFGDKTQELTVNVEPADARVLINGKWYDPPVAMEVSRREPITVTASREGYESHTVKSGVVLSKLGTVDAIGLAVILLPGIGLLSDGAYEIPNSHIFIQLDKKENADQTAAKK